MSLNCNITRIENRKQKQTGDVATSQKCEEDVASLFGVDLIQDLAVGLVAALHDDEELAQFRFDVDVAREEIAHRVERH